MKNLKFLFIVVLFTGCGTAEKDFSTVYDLTPPKLVQLRVIDESRVEFSFDEAVIPETENRSEAFSLNPHPDDPKRVILCLESPMQPGDRYEQRLTVTDDKGNGTSVLAVYYGFNPEKPLMVINELNPRGSDSTPDCIEFYIREGGLMGGVTVSLGPMSVPGGKYIFPNFRVSAGDYIILHCQPEGLVEERDELVDKGASQGKVTHPDAWDLWWRDGPGLPGNNGMVCLWNTPEGEPVDMVIYTDRITNLEDRYLGWTSLLFSQVSSALQEQAWVKAGDMITPDDSVPAGGSTATRSLCRSSGSIDTDSREDWHVVPTGKRSFGVANTDEAY